MMSRNVTSSFQIGLGYQEIKKIDLFRSSLYLKKIEDFYCKWIFERDLIKNASNFLCKNLTTTICRRKRKEVEVCPY
jgi:hypothetical protein